MLDHVFTSQLLVPIKDGLASRTRSRLKSVLQGQALSTDCCAIMRSTHQMLVLPWQRDTNWHTECMHQHSQVPWTRIYHMHARTHVGTHTLTPISRFLHMHTHIHNEVHTPHCRQHNVCPMKASWNSSAYRCSFSFWLLWERPQMGASPQHHEAATYLH